MHGRFFDEFCFKLEVILEEVNIFCCPRNRVAILDWFEVAVLGPVQSRDDEDDADPLADDVAHMLKYTRH